ncbi:CHASE2 domain-containing protein [Phormidium nigroviride]
MSKIVILEIGNVDSEQRYPVNLRIGDSINSTIIESRGWFPPVTEFLEAYNNLQEARIKYRFGSSRTLEELEDITRALEHINKGIITKVSVQELASSVKLAMSKWLNDGDSRFRPVRDKLLQILSAERGNIRLMIQTDDVHLWGFPWHLWDILDNLKVEPIFSRLTNTKFDFQPINPKTKVRILAILGDSTKIDVEADLSLLKESIAYDNAEIETLVATSRHNLNEQLWVRNWDIIFFAGHSSSSPDYSQGKLAISENETIPIADLKYGLANAIKHGLKLVIFNSCDGMGLVNELASLQIPAVIAMRERVPDQVAQKFLEYFLEAFAREKKCLRDSVRKARERLHGMEGEYPCASWLPMIYEDPSVEPATWIELLKGNEEERQRVSIWPNLRAVLMISLLVTGVVMGLRWVGILQAWELKSYDQMLQIRPREGKEKRILVIEVTENDLQLPEQKDKKGSLSEVALDKVLEKLEQYQAKVIGLNIYYDFSINPKMQNLITRFQQSKNFITICKINDPSDGNPGVKPSPHIPPEDYQNRISFSDFPPDSDGVVRRHILAIKPDIASSCMAEQAFSLQLAFQYLKLTKGILHTYKEGNLQIGKTVFKRLQNQMGGYQSLKDNSYQIMLNYRSDSSPLEVITKVRLAQFLNGEVRPEDVKDKIVLIGTTAQSYQAYHPTPYSTNGQSYQKLPNIIIQAQMVSQLITAVLDERPLIWWWDFWVDSLWVCGWAFVGGAIAWRSKSTKYLILIVGASVGILYGVCFVFLTQSGWVPFIPSGLALVATSSAVLSYKGSQNTAE